MRPLLLLFSLLLSSCLLRAQSPAFITDSLDRYIGRGMADWQIPGLAIAIVKDGKVILSKGFGVREAGKNEPVDENTLFLIASNTKLFTGTALAKLDEDKKLSLNDKVTKFFPDYRLYDPTSTALVTVRDLLCHRLGTKTFQGDFTFWNTNLPRAEVIRRMRLLKPTGQFRQDYGYCNSAFVTAGEIIPKVTGQSWEAYIETNLLKPLGMTNTYMLTAGAENRPNMARPHTNSFGALRRIPYDVVDNLGPAGSMVSSVKDLSQWLMMQLDSGRLNGQRILPWSVVQRTRDANTIVGSRKSTVLPRHFQTYGLGVLSADYAGRQIFWHTGGAFGFVTNTCFVPEEKLAITILTNNDNQSFFEALRYQILDAYLGVPYTNRSNFFLKQARVGMVEEQATLKALADRVAKGNKPPMPLTAFAGTYRNELYGSITLKPAGTGLDVLFEHHPRMTARLEYMDDNTFRLTYSNQAFGVFPARFTLDGTTVKSVEIKASDFVEYDPYVFTKVDR
ncbi:serine hydrolase [Rudanella paleaurantiibacter]|uniref:Serine hydrolase n=1 Tax=Rudanella paleaurantiibacter TaxID=2614655 RepID=A0A7J5TY21_9BACT|nr:serine hydrolase [Rudanella paleaurantiibacter]KAB7730046.1 serine hydrolase [Rudanella paleaurantiibacter]